MSDQNPFLALSALTPAQSEALPLVIQQVIGPVMKEMCTLMRNNNEALNQLADAQRIQSDRMEALERQIRLNTPVTQQQVRYINDAIRSKARDVLYKRGVDDDKAARKLGTAIRKSILARYGIGTLHEIPRHEYSVTMSHVSTWNDMLCIRDAVKEVRERAATAEKDRLAICEQAPRDDGTSALSGPGD